MAQNNGVCMIGSVFHSEGDQQDIANATLWVDDGIELKLLKNEKIIIWLNVSFFRLGVQEIDKQLQ